MREIKFRAWEKNKRIMSYTDEDLRIDITTEMYVVDSSGDFEDYEIMQFTGLKDKNGKEIYEGDIVNFTLYDGEPNKKWVVELNKKMDYGLLPILETEVIGNIYENPELKKEIKK